MEPPIASGTILQNRYHLIRVLGQGGFGRTYLAEDLNRFNELCALKELIPPQTEASGLSKARELFQREATTLYQIQHPQVPKFRETFEQDGRLFLVQDYVEGKTYHELLNDRIAQLNPPAVQQPPSESSPPPPTRLSSLGQSVFSESEVKQLLLQLLPVLDHVHSKGIIHRDITPDNIIQRSSDRIPVLIDFGVVKELATRFQNPGVATPATTVGKLGYAPSEQIQTGRSYPSSDLYSLAVTAVVLLTGKDPQDLLDNTQLTWDWRRWANVSEDFAQVLNRMLSYRPGDRYQSASDVLQALQSPHAAPPPPSPDPSRMATVAVGRRPEPEAAAPGRAEETGPAISEPGEESIWERPGAVILIGVGLALLTGFTSWAIVSAFKNRADDPGTIGTVTESPTPTVTETTPTPLETESPTPIETESPTPTPTPGRPTTYSQRLNLSPGRSIEVSRTIRPNATVNYIIEGQQGQQLQAFIPTEGVYMTVLGPDGDPLSQATRVQRWQGTLPFTGEYTLQLSPIQSLEETDYTLEASLSRPATPTPQPTETPPASPSPSPSYDTEPLSFPEGEEAIQFSGQTRPQRIKRYVVDVESGQQLGVEVAQGNVTLNIRYPNGQVIEDASGVKLWQAQVPRAGEYTIDVLAQQPANFTLSVSRTSP